MHSALLALSTLVLLPLPQPASEPLPENGRGAAPSRLSLSIRDLVAAGLADAQARTVAARLPDVQEARLQLRQHRITLSTLQDRLQILREALRADPFDPATAAEHQGVSQQKAALVTACNELETLIAGTLLEGIDPSVSVSLANARVLKSKRLPVSWCGVQLTSADHRAIGQAHIAEKRALRERSVVPAEAAALLASVRNQPLAAAAEARLMNVHGSRSLEAD